MDNRRRTMDKPTDSELPAGLSIALQRGRLPTSSTASATACQTKCNYEVCQIKCNKKCAFTLASKEYDS